MTQRRRPPKEETHRRMVQMGEAFVYLLEHLMSAHGAPKCCLNVIVEHTPSDYAEYVEKYGDKKDA